jgi:uncharacterized protein (DUF2062 family)
MTIAVVVCRLWMFTNPARRPASATSVWTWSVMSMNSVGRSVARRILVCRYVVCAASMCMAVLRVDGRRFAAASPKDRRERARSLQQDVSIS